MSCAAAEGYGNAHEWQLNLELQERFDEEDLFEHGRTHASLTSTERRKVYA